MSNFGSTKTSWYLAGNKNTNPANDFVGTTDLNALVLRTNNLKRWEVTAPKGRLLYTNYATDDANVCVGIIVGNETSTGQQNCFVGALSGRFLTTGNNNTALGMHSLRNITTANENVSIGYFACRETITGSGNVAVGIRNLYFTVAGNNNTALGHRAGEFISSGSNNTCVGANTNITAGGNSNELNISNAIYGNGLTGAGAGNIGIGTNASHSKLQVAGSEASLITTITASTTLGSHRYIAVNNGSTPITITLPNASGIQGRTYDIKLLGTGSVTVTPTTGTIDGSLAFTLVTQWEYITVVSDGTNWLKF